MIMLLSCHISSKWSSLDPDPQLAVDATQRNQIGAIKVLSVTNRQAISLQRGLMSAPFRSESAEVLTQELRNAATSSPSFDRDLAAKIGKRIAMRRSLFGFSKQQLGARLGVDAMEVEAYEQGEKRVSCKLLLETARQLKAAPRFFFQ
jgi:hypothetical protein